MSYTDITELGSDGDVTIIDYKTPASYSAETSSSSTAQIASDTAGAYGLVQPVQADRTTASDVAAPALDPASGLDLDDSAPAAANKYRVARNALDTGTVVGSSDGVDFVQEMANGVWGPTAYLGPEEQQQRQIAIEDGALQRPSKNGVDPMDTETKHRAQAHGSEENRYIYAMDGQGELFAADADDEVAQLNHREQTGRVGPGETRFHHSSLVHGQPVAAAGEMQVTGGVLEKISDVSGHYMRSVSTPDFDEPVDSVPFLRQAVQELDERGVPMEGVEAETKSHGGLKGAAIELLGYGDDDTDIGGKMADMRVQKQGYLNEMAQLGDGALPSQVMATQAANRASGAATAANAVADPRQDDDDDDGVITYAEVGDADEAHDDLSV